MAPELEKLIRPEEMQRLGVESMTKAQLAQATAARVNASNSLDVVSQENQRLRKRLGDVHKQTASAQDWRQRKLPFLSVQSAQGRWHNSVSLGFSRPIRRAFGASCPGPYHRLGDEVALSSQFSGTYQWRHDGADLLRAPSKTRTDVAG